MGHPQWIWGIPQATHGTQPEKRRFNEVTVVGAAPIIRSQAPHGRWILLGKNRSQTEMNMMNEVKEHGSNPGVEMDQELKQLKLFGFCGPKLERRHELLPWCGWFQG